MALMNEKVTEVWSACSEPCLYYNNVKGIGQVKLRSVSLIVTRVHFLKVGSTPIISIKKNY